MTAATMAMIQRLRRPDAALIALAVLLVATSAMRLTIGADRPLWLDEVWTGMIVTQPSVAEFARQCAYDINAPLYYVLAALWAQVSGVSDHALRLLPALVGVAAPLLALWPRKLIDRPTRYAWCGLLACWLPGVWYSQEARWYTLAFALGVANAVAFASLLSAPSRRRAWVWTTISSLMILAHYYGLILAGIQGLTYLAVHRRRAVATWPAVLAFAPAAAAIAVHLRPLMAFVGPSTGWIKVTGPRDFLAEVSFIFGAELLIYLTALWLAAVGLVWWLGRRAVRPACDADGRAAALWLVAGCSLAAILFALALGAFEPVLVARYLIEFTPGVFLGLALAASRLARRWRTAGAVLVALYLSVTCLWAIKPHWGEHPLNFEFASRALMADHPSRLVFLWDTPTRPQASALAGVGGFFFKRAGRPISVDAISVAPGQDPNTLLLAHAAAPGSAILWLYDTYVSGTAAVRFRPDIPRLDPAWRCRNFGLGRQFGVIACDRARSK